MLRQLPLRALSLLLVCPALVVAQAPPQPAHQPAAAPNPSEKQGPPKPGEQSAPSGDKLVTTEHQVTLRSGSALKYKATAGTLNMKDEAGKPKADVFFVAYDKLPAPENPATRPITFVFNGGPGAAAVWLHLGTAGPRKVRLNEEGQAPPSDPYDAGIDMYSLAMGMSGRQPAAPGPATGSDAFWEGIVAVATFDDGALRLLQVHPVDLGWDRPAKRRGVPRKPVLARAVTILERLVRLSEPYDTRVRIEDGVGAILERDFEHVRQMQVAVDHCVDQLALVLFREFCSVKDDRRDDMG